MQTAKDVWSILALKKPSFARVNLFEEFKEFVRNEKKLLEEFKELSDDKKEEKLFEEFKKLLSDKKRENLFEKFKEFVKNKNEEKLLEKFKELSDDKKEEKFAEIEENKRRRKQLFERTKKGELVYRFFIVLEEEEKKEEKFRNVLYYIKEVINNTYYLTDDWTYSHRVNSGHTMFWVIPSKKYVPRIDFTVCDNTVFIGFPEKDGMKYESGLHMENEKFTSHIVKYFNHLSGKAKKIFDDSGLYISHLKSLAKSMGLENEGIKEEIKELEEKATFYGIPIK